MMGPSKQGSPMDARLAKLMSLAKANATIHRERLQNMEASLADFDGAVQGIWAGLNKDGSCNVKYRGKNYIAVPEGKTAIPAGTKVSLSFRKNHYIADW